MQQLLRSLHPNGSKWPLSISLNQTKHCTIIARSKMEQVEVLSPNRNWTSSINYFATQIKIPNIPVSKHLSAPSRCGFSSSKFWPRAKLFASSQLQLIRWLVESWHRQDLFHQQYVMYFLWLKTGVIEKFKSRCQLRARFLPRRVKLLDQLPMLKQVASSVQFPYLIIFETAPLKCWADYLAGNSPLKATTDEIRSRMRKALCHWFFATQTNTNKGWQITFLLKEGKNKRKNNLNLYWRYTHLYCQ